MWDLWLHGIPGESVCPFRWFRQDDFNAKANRVNLTRTKACMEELGAVAVANGLARDKKEIHNMAMSETDQVFQSSIEIRCPKCKTFERVVRWNALQPTLPQEQATQKKSRRLGSWTSSGPVT